MIRIQIEPVWRFTKDEGTRSLLVMLDFLHEIRTTGKITQAADQAGISYRHAWNLIEKWSTFFDAPLVDRRQGRGTTLSPLGDKLVWAGQRLRARLKPQLDNLSQELETEINQFLPHGPAIIRVHASHGFAVAKLREMLSHEPDIGVDLRYVSNQTSLASLARGECDLAGMHLPQGELRQRSIAACKEWLSPAQHRVIGFVTREMGLIVKNGNPLKIRSLDRLLDPAIRFVNRDPDSGTRRLFEQLLAQHQLDGSRINGYAQMEFTHAAVAAYVASGMADVSFGVEAAARQFDLGFVRLLTEDYFFVCLKQLPQLEAMKRVLSIMRSPAFHAAISRLPGYAVKDAGTIKTAAEVFRKEG
ncbi:MAG TPA: substrate-binding domain-containing protein [Steroidobacteraceae bacterium]|nr:substrate-binding domain-containing protein [Steroidobacteraceae bacterium]